MRVSLLGTGLMGFLMAERLLKAGHSVSVYNRTRSKALPLLKQGAQVVSIPSLAIRSSECVILMLANFQVIEEILFRDQSMDWRGKTIIQMGTIGSGESLQLSKKLKKLHADYLECPVLGSRKETSEGKLILMFGGSRKQFSKWQVFLKVFGSKPRYIGEVGKAAVMKLALNQLIASHAVAFALSLGLVEKSQIDVDQFTDILKESVLFAPMYEKKLSNWLKRNYLNPNFPTQHLLKDLRLILKEAKTKKIQTKSLEALDWLYQETMNQGYVHQDYTAVFNVINRIPS
jgi:3-hydroxyisobutyrate dehydrogenase